MDLFKTKYKAFIKGYKIHNPFHTCLRLVFKLLIDIYLKKPYISLLIAYHLYFNRYGLKVLSPCNIDDQLGELETLMAGVAQNNCKEINRG